MHLTAIALQVHHIEKLRFYVHINAIA